MLFNIWAFFWINYFMNRLTPSEIGNFDEFINRLSKCKILNEQEVKILCEKAK